MDREKNIEILKEKLKQIKEQTDVEYYLKIKQEAKLDLNEEPIGKKGIVIPLESNYGGDKNRLHFKIRIAILNEIENIPAIQKVQLYDLLSKKFVDGYAKKNEETAVEYFLRINAKVVLDEAPVAAEDVNHTKYEIHNKISTVIKAELKEKTAEKRKAELFYNLMKFKVGFYTIQAEKKLNLTPIL